MKHSRPLALALAGALSATGCATAHLNGEYRPDGVPGHGGDVSVQTEKQTIAEGSDWVFFWGIVEVASDDLGDTAKEKMHPNEVLTETEVRNHISLPGTLLWLVTAGLVSHHDLCLRGRIATVTPPPPPPVAMVPVERDRTIIMTQNEHAAAVHEGSFGTMTVEDMFVSTTIDRPLSEVQGCFNSAAIKVGLIPEGEIAWASLGSRERGDLRGTVPENRLDGVPLDRIRTFLVTNDALANDVRREPKCGAFVPGIVCFEKDGKTQVIYGRFSQHLRAMEASGNVGEGKCMTRSKYEEHLGYAIDFERSEQRLIDELNRGK